MVMFALIGTSKTDKDGLESVTVGYGVTVVYPYIHASHLSVSLSVTLSLCSPSSPLFT
jgi:hypothetical protein